MPGLLLSWYDAGNRILPWRSEPTPYHVWLSEIMLQQTRVEAVKPYYDRFLHALPDIAHLASAGEDELLKLWEGLGYYNRVRNLQKAAVIIMRDYDGEMPHTQEELMKLPGIGRYTSGAIASIAYGQPDPAVDGNVLRVLSRLRRDERNISEDKTKQAVEAELREVMPQDRPGDFNQSMMELGAMVCAPNGAPKCETCPLSQICESHAAGTWDRYPVKAAKKPRVIEHKTVLVIRSDQRVVFGKRPSKGLLAGMYEFPCLEGKVDADTALEAVKRMGLKPLRIQPLGEARHIFTHKEWHMCGYVVQIDELSEIEQTVKKQHLYLARREEAEERFPIPSAYAAYTKYL